MSHEQEPPQNNLAETVITNAEGEFKSGLNVAGENAREGMKNFADGLIGQPYKSFVNIFKAVNEPDQSLTKVVAKEAVTLPFKMGGRFLKAMGDFGGSLLHLGGYFNKEK